MPGTPVEQRDGESELGGGLGGQEQGETAWPCRAKHAERLLLNHERCWDSWPLEENSIWGQR